MFKNPDIFYLNNPEFRGPWELSEQYTTQIKQSKLVIVDLSSEHWGPNGLDTAYEKFNSSGINFLLLSHEPSDHLKFERMLHYPHWYHWSIKNFTSSGKISDSKQYLWSCLNSNPRFHRIHNYILSRKKFYFRYAKFSMHNLPDESSDNYQELTQEINNEWQQLRGSLPDRNLLAQQSKRIDAQLALPELTDAYIHLVTETNVAPRVFISEKTWKPIAMQQIFLVFGNPGTIQTLRDAGVDVFDDIVDHSYDHELDWQVRLDKIHQSLELLLSQDLPVIYQQTQSRREQNQLKFKNSQFNLQYQRDLSAAVARYL